MKTYKPGECPKCGSSDIQDGQDDGIAQCCECCHQWDEQTGKPADKTPDQD